MTDRQKRCFDSAQRCRDNCLQDCARAALDGDLPMAQCCARVAASFAADMDRIASATACDDCGEVAGECSPTCGFDGPTASDAMADGAAHAD